MSNAVAFHPERVAGDPASLRWVFPDGAPPTAATALGSLVDEGVLTDLIVEPSNVVTTLADGLSWREHGPRIRTEIASAAQNPPPQDDDALRRVVDAILAGPAGTYVRSHGGRAELIDVRDGHVTLRLGGACTHCPAAGITIASTLEREIRARYPALVEVRRA